MEVDVSGLPSCTHWPLPAATRHTPRIEPSAVCQFTRFQAPPNVCGIDQPEQVVRLAASTQDTSPDDRWARYMSVPCAIASYSSPGWSPVAILAPPAHSLSVAGS